jgi:diadenylate cyclase
MKIGILLALSRNLIGKEDKVVCISGNSKNGVFDTVVTIDIAMEYEFFFTTAQNILPPDVEPEVLERVVGLAGEIAIEGREGKPVGTIFVLGDTNSVNAYVRQLIINPFRGYSEAERNIMDPGLVETIKEFAAIDGAFIITGDGIVLSAGSYLRPQITEELPALPGGYGARHAAAAGISACTNALAVTISESTGTVTIFKSGVIMMSISRPVVREKSLVQRFL